MPGHQPAFVIKEDPVVERYHRGGQIWIEVKFHELYLNVDDAVIYFVDATIFGHEIKGLQTDLSSHRLA